MFAWRFFLFVAFVSNPARGLLEYLFFRRADSLLFFRQPSAFISSISDERGSELIYGGMKLTEVFQKNMGLGGVLGLLWFRRSLPKAFCTFVEMVVFRSRIDNNNKSGVFFGSL